MTHEEEVRRVKETLRRDIQRAKWSATIVALVVVALIATVTYFTMSTHNRLMAECVADGHKRYECAAIFSRGGER